MCHCFWIVTVASNFCADKLPLCLGDEVLRVQGSCHIAEGYNVSSYVGVNWMLVVGQF
jgi:hypothetical protein